LQETLLKQLFFEEGTMKEIFSCTRCGYCCHGETTVSLDEIDQQKMLDFLEISREEAFAEFWRLNDRVVQMKVKEGHCIFFKDGCTIHKARPWRCRQWPMVPAILYDRVNLQTIQESCPGLNKEATYEKVCAMVRQENIGIEIKK
jgi:uncharacterized protein